MLHAGITSKVKDYGERFVNYYTAMKKHMEENPDNIFYESFRIDKFNTAKKCLQWRDTLAAAGWSKATKQASARMKALAGVEKYFTDICFEEELREVVKQIESGCTLPDLEIETAHYYKSFSPLEVRLLSALKNRNVPITCTKPSSDENNIRKVYNILQGKKGVALDRNDDSLEIWKFSERNEAIKFLTLMKADEFDVWINGDNKEFDNWQKLAGNPLSGSSFSGATEITQLLNIGLGIFETPLNIYRLVEWLNTSVNPLPQTFRIGLSEKICESGGYYNETCRNYIQDYLEKFPNTKERIDEFLPDVNAPQFYETDIETCKVKTFIENLKKWCTKQMVLDSDERVSKQLSLVINQADNVLLMLDNYESDTISCSDIEAMVSVFPVEFSITQYEAQVGSKYVINSCCDFCNDADKTIWCDFYQSGNTGKLTYSFLSPVESEKFSEALELWERAKEQEYIRNLILTPFVKTKKKLVLVMIDKVGSESASKNPIYIQLEKYFADKEAPNEFYKNLLNHFIKQKMLDESLLSEVKLIDNRMESEEEFVKIKNVDYIKENWPTLQSYSSLDELINHPIDYVIDRFVGFTSASTDTVKDVNTTLGLVSHKIIEKLFNHVDGVEQSGTPSYIKKQIDKNFDAVFEEAVQSMGAILCSKKTNLNCKNLEKR